MSTALGPVRDQVYDILAAECRAPSLAELACRMRFLRPAQQWWDDDVSTCAMIPSWHLP